MQKQSVCLKDINALGYDIIATVYQTDTFKASIKYDTNGKLLIIHEDRVICSFHTEKSESDEGTASAAFSQNGYEQ